jgi:outer membrane protein assembly factor BamB
MLLLGLSVLPAAAADWNQWLGPSRDGRASFVAPAAWPEKPARLWRVTVGEGHSSPVVGGDRVFVFSREGDAEVLRALALADGRELWKTSYPAPYQMNPAAIPHGKGPKSTPVVAEGKVCSFGISGILSCHAAADGKLAWRHDFSKMLGSAPAFFGSSASPLVDAGTLYLNIGSDSQGSFRAFDLATGATRWDAPGLKPAYASAMLFEIGGRKQIVTLTFDAIVGLDPASGKLLWQQPYIDQYHQNTPTPLRVGEMLFFGNIDNGSFGARLVPAGQGLKLEQVWKDEQNSWYMTSPITDGRRIYALTDKQKGQLLVVKPESGEVLWKSPGRQGENASLALAGELLLMVDTDGELTVWKAGDQPQLLRTYTIAESPVWASAAWTDKLLVVKDRDGVAAWSFAAGPAAGPAAAERRPAGN